MCRGTGVRRMVLVLVLGLCLRALWPHKAIGAFRPIGQIQYAGITQMCIKLQLCQESDATAE